MGESPGSSQERGSQRHRFCALVTRPRTEASELAQALAARGIEAIIEPVLEIRYHGGPAPDLAGVQAILCTSGNGVRAVARLCRERNVRVFAVGDATAARARSEGFTQIEHAGGNVADLARLVRWRLRPEGGRLLHVAGTAIAGDLAGELHAAGFRIERAVLYEARPAAVLNNDCVGALAAGTVDAALFFSPRTAAIFARLIDEAGLVNAVRVVAAVSISAAASAALEPLRFRERQVAERPDQPSLLAALDRLVAEKCSA